VAGLRVGTSGWQYDDWRPTVYPPGLGQSRWLTRYAELFDTVEVNGTFYRLPSITTVQRWAAATPPDFRFAVKASRYLTHVRRLVEPEDPCTRFLERVHHLGAKLGPILVQLPPHFPPDPQRLEATLEAFARADGVRVSVEVRDDRWHDDRVYDLLARHGAALCWWDRRGAHGPLVRTSDWVYLRMHEGRSRSGSAYGVRALGSWCERIVAAFGEQAEGWVYFNNDHRAAAPRNAAELRRAAVRVGLTVD
jgi:uncharacterized protein YecE (DUF72 family)